MIYQRKNLIQRISYSIFGKRSKFKLKTQIMMIKCDSITKLMKRDQFEV